jgi:hypothetical protein
MFSSADLSLAVWKMRKNQLFTGGGAASGMILQNQRWLPVGIFSVKIAALGSLKRVTGGIFKLVSNFKEVSC